MHPHPQTHTPALRPEHAVRRHGKGWGDPPLLAGLSASLRKAGGLRRCPRLSAVSPSAFPNPDPPVTKGAALVSYATEGGGVAASPSGASKSAEGVVGGLGPRLCGSRSGRRLRLALLGGRQELLTVGG